MKQILAEDLGEEGINAGKGPGPWKVCLEPAGSVWVLDVVQEKFHSISPGD